MLISDLAAKTGVSIDTVRFYEKRGLLDEQHFTRSANNYRHYNGAAVERLTLIREAQAAGITLAEMRESIDAWEAGAIEPEQKVAFFDRKMRQIEARIAALQRVRDYLETKLRSVDTPAM